MYKSNTNEIANQVMNRQVTNAIGADIGKDEIIKLRVELANAQKQIAALKQNDEEKSKKLEQQRADLTKLRKESFDIKAQVNTLKFQLDEEKKKNKELIERGAGGGNLGNNHDRDDLR